jgi:GT2 family glycosyltransferase/glycosyltransferase involved in cell wall biosynthesis
MTPIDVIVPVYRGVEATRRCIESVWSTALSTRQQTPFELVVVNDACPEPELIRWLREHAARSRLTLLDQPLRKGFAAAVNRAIALHPERDVVILHSDAEVANDWLDRLVAPTSAACDIGTVVPFTNYGGIAGYPRTDVKNAMPAGHTLTSLDLLFRRANADSSVTTPLACGPCVFVRRACLDAVGPFDGGPLGSDYGVEQDFCLRASGAGFRHALAADVYVWHQGATAFGAGEAQDLAARAERALGKLYPHFPAQRAEFSTRDPARTFQRRVDLLRLAESPRQLLLFIAHGWGGGVRRHMDHLAEMVSERCNVLLLQPNVGDTVTLSWPREGEGFAAYFALPAELPALVSLLRGLGLVRMHFHHVHGLPRAVLDLPGGVGVPYDCTLHDYYAICPQYHLNAEDGRYCGEPDPLGCAACLARRPGQWGMDITEWRGAFGRLLRGADRVLAPSRDVAQRIARYFPDVDALVMPHPEVPCDEPGRITRVVTLGNLSPEKGLRIVAACAADAHTRRLPLSFRVLGPTAEPLPQWPDAPLSIQGQYADEDLATLIASERPDVIWFPSQVPETYSYTLSAALAAGTAIVASALGVLPERTSSQPRAVLVRWNATPAEWNDALLKAGALASSARPSLSRVAIT